MVLDKPFSVAPPVKPAHLPPNAIAPTPVELEAASSGRTLRPLQELLQERRVWLGSKPLPWPEVAVKLPVKFG